MFLNLLGRVIGQQVLVIIYVLSKDRDLARGVSVPKEGGDGVGLRERGLTGVWGCCRIRLSTIKGRVERN